MGECVFVVHCDRVPWKYQQYTRCLRLQKRVASCSVVLVHHRTSNQHESRTNPRVHDRSHIQNETALRLFFDDPHSVASGLVVVLACRMLRSVHVASPLSSEELIRLVQRDNAPDIGLQFLFSKMTLRVSRPREYYGYNTIVGVIGVTLSPL